jgi:hypothetical protein
LACGVAFPLRAQSPNQAYCSDAACQRDRRKLWQRERRQRDDDYRDNQARAHARWLAKNPDYWTSYRSAHPEYVERNRAQQRNRGRSQASSNVANMDPSSPALPSGVYLLTAPGRPIAKMDSWIVEIRVLSKS